MGNKRSDGPTRKVQPVTKKPEASKFVDCCNLSMVAWLMRRVFKRDFTVNAIAGAIRHLDLKNDDMRRKITYRGSLVHKQQTAVHVSKLKLIEQYIASKSGE